MHIRRSCCLETVGWFRSQSVWLASKNVSTLGMSFSRFTAVELL